MVWAGKGERHWCQSLGVVARRQRWEHSDNEVTVAMEETSLCWRLKGESREETPGHGFSLSVQTQPPIDPTLTDTSWTGEGPQGPAPIWFEQCVTLHTGFYVLRRVPSIYEHCLIYDTRCSRIIWLFPGSPSSCSGSDIFVKVPTPNRATLYHLDLDASCFLRAGGWGPVWGGITQALFKLSVS